MSRTAEIEQRTGRLREAMRRENVACLVLTEGANFEYVTGLGFDPLWTSPARSLVAVLPVDGTLHLLVPEFLTRESREALPSAVVLGYEAPPEDPVPLLLEMIHDFANEGRVGLELGGEARIGLPPRDLPRLLDSIGRERCVDGQAVMWQTRMRKSPFELDRLRRAGAAAASGFEALFGAARLGVSEEEAARLLGAEALRAGADRAGWVAVTAGAGSYHRFVGRPRDRRLGRGDMLWADLGVLVDGYWSDYCRAGVVDGPTATQRDLQERIIRVTEAGVAAVSPGVPVGKVARACRVAAEAAGVEMLGYGRLGHGIGLSATEPPSIAEWDATILEPGMVVTIEPAVSTNDGLFCAEQVVIVTRAAAEVISTAPLGLSSI